MKLVKSLLLGSAAGLAAVAGAQAADLPVRKAAAVEYVRVCSTYGAGFFYVPGTEACIKIGGRVRADGVYLEPFTRAQDAIGIRVRGRIQVDHRQATAYGLLRTFIRFEITRNAGLPVGAGGSVATGADVAQAFVQFGGLTAGRVTSFFSNPDLPTSHMGTLRFDDAPDVNLFAYTYSFGNGFSATIAAEDGINRRVNGSPILLGAGDATFAPFATYGVVYGGQTVPDVVGNIRYAGTWGSVQLSGVVHQIRDVGFNPATGTRTNPITGLPLQQFADTEYGWAVGLSASYLLPFIGAGDSVWMSAAYSSGAASYSGFGSGVGFGTFANVSSGNVGVADAIINPFNGDLEKTDIWNIAGGFTHFWSPEFRSSIFGSYARVEYGSVGNTVTTGGASIGYVDFDEWRIGANTFWSPVSGLNLGVEVIYAEADPRGRVFERVAGPYTGVTTLGSDVGAIEGRIRVQRDF